MAMARPAKPLWELVRARSFRPGRHAALLERDDLPSTAPEHLRRLQEHYRSAPSERQRRAIAVDFRDAVRQDNPSPGRLEIDMKPTVVDPEATRRAAEEHMRRLLERDRRERELESVAARQFATGEEVGNGVAHFRSGRDGL